MYVFWRLPPHNIVDSRYRRQRDLPLCGCYIDDIIDSLLAWRNTWSTSKRSSRKVGWKRWVRDIISFGWLSHRLKSTNVFGRSKVFECNIRCLLDCCKQMWFLWRFKPFIASKNPLSTDSQQQYILYLWHKRLQNRNNNHSSPNDSTRISPSP